MTATTVGPTRARALTDRRACVLLAAMVALLAVPYALLGPRFILDDLHFLRNGHFDGVFAAGGHRQLVARPVAWLLYAVQFGAIGAHPLVLYVVQTVANAVVAVALFLTLRHFLARRVALAVAAAWVLLPSHTSMSRWFATLPAVVALLLLVVGTDRLRAATDAGRWPVAAVVCFAIGGLAYEAVLPAATVAIVAIPWLRRTPWRPDVIVPGAGLLAVVAAWAWGHRLYTSGVARSSMTILFPVHFGPGLSWSYSLGVLVGVAAAVAIVWALLRRDPLVIGGLAVIAVGSAAFVNWPWTLTGINDRANVVGAVGGAMVWVGVGSILWRARRPLFIAGAALLLVTVVPTHLQRDHDYVDAGRDADRVLALTDTVAHPAGPIVVWPEPHRHHDVYALLDWMMPSAVQLHRDDRHAQARLLASPPATPAGGTVLELPAGLRRP